MTKTEFIENIKRIVSNYQTDRSEMGPDPQLRINPMDLYASVVTSQEMQNEIAYTDEDIEVNAAAEGDASEAADDYEGKQDPDFYPLRELTDAAAIEKIAQNYF